MSEARPSGPTLSRSEAAAAPRPRKGCAGAALWETAQRAGLGQGSNPTLPVERSSDDPQQRRARLAEIQKRLEHFQTYPALSGAQEREADTLMVEALGLERDERYELIRSAAPDGGGSGLMLEHGAGTGPAQPRSTQIRFRNAAATRAAQTIDQAFRSGGLPDYAAERATALLDRGDEKEQALAVRWATAAGSPDYLSAFLRVFADPTRGHLEWSKEEIAAYREVARTTVRRSSGHGPARRPVCGSERPRVHQPEPSRPGEPLLGVPYTVNQMSYDLARLRLNGLIARRPGTNTYQLTADGQRVAIFYTKVHDRLLRPLIAADAPAAPTELRTALRNIDRHVHSYAATARLGKAA